MNSNETVVVVVLLKPTPTIQYTFNILVVYLYGHTDL